MHKVLSIMYGLFRKYVFILILIHTTYYLLLNTSSASAQTMSNEKYNLKMESINTTSGQESNPNINSDNTAQQVNYAILPGFEYEKSSLPFIFTISQASVDFGILYPTNPLTRTFTLSLSRGSATGYSIFSSQDHPPQNASESIIPDTTCDSGTCSESTGGLWTNTLTYGFGYRCDNVSGKDCSADFTTSNFYKQFADDSKNETGQPIMNSRGIGETSEAKITYKINIAGTQPQGNYGNTVTYIAVPNF